MPQYTSPGTLALSHFRNSRVSMEQWEPIYTSLFTVQIVPPAALGIGGQNSQEMLTVLEGVKSVSGLDSAPAPQNVEQKYKWATRTFAGAVPEKTTLDVTIEFELNLRYTDGSSQPENYTMKILRAWHDLVWDPLTGRQGLKRDYACTHMIITMQDRAGMPYWQWILYNAWPTSGISGPALNYTSSDVMSASMTWRCDYFDEAML